MDALRLQFGTMLSSATPHSNDAADRLSERQLQCLRLAASGLTSTAIALEMSVSPRTVDEHIAMACRTLGVRTRVQAVARLTQTQRRLTEPRSFLP